MFPVCSAKEFTGQFVSVFATAGGNNVDVPYPSIDPDLAISFATTKMLVGEWL